MDSERESLVGERMADAVGTAAAIGQVFGSKKALQTYLNSMQRALGVDGVTSRIQKSAGGNDSSDMAKLRQRLHAAGLVKVTKQR